MLAQDPAPQHTKTMEKLVEYITEDGTSFSTHREALEYERQLTFQKALAEFLAKNLPDYEELVTEESTEKVLEALWKSISDNYVEFHKVLEAAVPKRIRGRPKGSKNGKRGPHKRRPKLPPPPPLKDTRKEMLSFEDDDGTLDAKS